MKNLKRILIAATLLITLVGGAGQASADPGIPLPTTTITPTAAGVSWEGFGLFLSAGISWED
ncbi:MAG TPA: hypothetical protein VEP48_01160 [Methylomirabilota bacterium]|nr:hypothetical protein [Methylomirabilota bacterium]